VVRDDGGAYEGKWVEKEYTADSYPCYGGGGTYTRTTLLTSLPPCRLTLTRMIASALYWENNVSHSLTMRTSGDAATTDKTYFTLTQGGFTENHHHALALITLTLALTLALAL
jgi:hypothetical protein